MDGYAYKVMFIVEVIIMSGQIFLVTDQISLFPDIVSVYIEKFSWALQGHPYSGETPPKCTHDSKSFLPVELAVSFGQSAKHVASQTDKLLMFNEPSQAKILQCSYSS